MLGKIYIVLKILINPRLFKKLLSMPYGGYLKEIGWIEAFNNKLPVDAENNPIPWVTYSFIDFISERLTKEMDIFEYGSGNSTFWYANRVNTVVSIEHDYDWYLRIKKSLPSNAVIYSKKLVYGGEYAVFPNTLNSYFDIIIVDGRDRVNALKNSLTALKPNGVIVLDDSERDRYNDGVTFLLNNGFKKIDFWGISPGLFYKRNTTVFYRINNCLDI